MAYSPAAGSAPEAIRAYVQAVVDRPNICGHIAYHTFSGVHLRPYAGEPDERFPPDDLRVLQGLRILRFFKIARYSPALSTLMQVVAEERRALFGTLLLLLCATVFAAARL